MIKSRVFLFALLSFIIGVALRSFIQVPVILIWITVSGGLALAVFALAKSKKKAAVCRFLLMVFALGIFRFEQAKNSEPDLSGLYGKEVVLRGYVAEDPERTLKIQRLKFWVESVGEEKISPGFYVLISLDKYPQYKIGDELRVQDMLDRPENFAEFDYVSYLSKEDIFSTMFFPRVSEKIGENKGNKLKLFLSRIKHVFEENLDLALQEPHSAFLKGLTLGERESLPPDLVANFQKTGVTHIVALSGYNITVIGRFFVNTLLVLTVPFQVSFWIATSAIFLFVMLTGASPSVVRAGIMGILVLIAQREGRLYHMTNALALAGAVMIFQNPKILRFDAAFQLSFLATLGLVYLSPRVENFFEKARYKSSHLLVWRRISQGGFKNLFHPYDNNIEYSGRWEDKFSFSRKELNPERKKTPERQKIFPLKQIFIESLSAQIMVLPLLIFLFGRVSLISPITNLLVLIVVPYSMALGFLTGFLGFLWGPLAQISGMANWILLEYQIRVIEFFAKFPLAQVEFGSFAVLPALAIYAGLLSYLWRKSKII